MLTVTPATVAVPLHDIARLGKTESSWYHGVLSSPVQMALQQSQETSQAAETSVFPNLKVTSDPNRLPQNEPSISANPKNQSNVAAGANDYRLVVAGHQAWAGVCTSFNGGTTWSSKLIPGFPGDTVTTVLTGFDASADPALYFNSNGTLYYAGIAFNISGSSAVDGSVFVSASYDGGASFNQTVLVARGSRRIFNDKEYIAVDNTLGAFRGRVYVSWTMFGTTTGDIMVARSGDGGRTFSSPVKVSTSVVNQGSLPIVGPSGEVYVVWNDLSNNRIMVAKSSNGGVSFSAPVQVYGYVSLPSPLPNSLFRVNNNPTAAVDDINGKVYVAWSDYRNGNADILFSSSTNAGTTWLSPTKANDDQTTRDQFFPWMAVSQGRLSLDFYDRRLDPSNHLIDVFITQSTDGGANFSANQRVTSVSSNPDAVLFSGGQSFIGDYIGIASSPTMVYPAWTDLRNVGPGATTDQDIFAAALRNRDIAMSLLSSAKTVVYEGVSVSPVRLTASLENLGLSTETSVQVRFLSNGTLVGLNSTVSLSPGSMANVTLDWNTNSLAKGSYALSAEVIDLPGEAVTTNNNYTGLVVKVRFPGDVDGDRDVDIMDIATVALAFGSSPGGFNWNPIADIDNNLRVDIVDVSISALNFGKVDP